MKNTYEVNGEQVSAEDYWFYKFATNLEALKARANMVACEFGYWEAVANEAREERATRPD